VSNVAIIPARGGSKGIPLKNIADLNGKPLISYTIEAALKSEVFEKVVVSTDDPRIEQVSRQYQITVIRRPKRLALDTTATELVLLHVLNRLEKENCTPDVVCLLQPTSPLRNELDICRAYRKFIREKVDSLLSVTRNYHFVWRQHSNQLRPMNYNYHRRPRRQAIRDQFKENGAIYFTKYKILKANQNRLGGRIGYYLMDGAKSLEIDSPIDLEVAKQILRSQHLGLT